MSTDFRAISDGMAAVVKSAGLGVVQVDARRRHPASGIIWSADGVIVTANHVVRRDNIRVGLPDGTGVEATLIGRDPGIDLAALRVESDELTAIQWSPEEELSVGELVLALGRPGRRVQASLGVLSAVGEEWRVHGGGKISHFVRPDLVMYPGFSGGPIVGGNGQVIGMATSALTRDGGIALTQATVAPTVDSLLKHGSVRRGYLGVGVQTVRLPAKLATELDQETGVLLNLVEPDSPAERGGLVVGDILTALDSETIGSPQDLAVALRGNRAGKETPMQIIRGGAARDISVEIGISEQRAVNVPRDQ